jgi:hypothetical protein
MTTGISTLVRRPAPATGSSAAAAAAGGGGSSAAAGGGGSSAELVSTVLPSEPQVPAPPEEFSVTLSVYSHTLERNMCPNFILSFEDQFQVDPQYPTSVLGIYQTENARLFYLKGVLPAAKSGRDIPMTHAIYSKYGFGQFNLSQLIHDFFPRGSPGEKTRIYLCCCSGLTFAPTVPGSIRYHSNIPGVPSSPLVNNISNRGVLLKQIDQAIKAHKAAVATGNEEQVRATRNAISDLLRPA